MKILRSVTQQFMQSSSPKVPTGFQQIARVKVGGQMFIRSSIGSSSRSRLHRL